MEHARRLETLWAGEFGQQYTDRNFQERSDAGVFHHALCDRLGIRRILEVGCNISPNLTRLASDKTFETWGVDLNRYALSHAKIRLPSVHFVLASAYRLPFSDGTFDLTFTCGLLIHIPPESLGEVIGEVYRTSRRYIWCGEYYSEGLIEIPYRGQSGALYKCDFGSHYIRSFPNLQLLERGFLDKENAGFDNATWWLFEKR